MKTPIHHLAILLCFTALTAPAQVIQDNIFTNAASGKWENPANWSLGTPPSVTDTTSIFTNAGTKTVTIDATTVSNAPGSLTVNNLVVGMPATNCCFDVNTLVLNNSGTNSPLQVLNSFSLRSGGGLILSNAALSVHTFNLGAGIAGWDPRPPDHPAFLTLQSNAQVTVSSNFAIATGSNSFASVQIAAGWLNVTNGVLSEGNDGTLTNGTGTGIMTISNATLTAKTVLLGSSVGGAATLTLGPAGTMNVSSNLVVGKTDTNSFTPDQSGTNAVFITGGTLNITNGTTIIGSGQITMSNGIFRAGSVEVGDPNGVKGTASLNLLGGTMSATNVTFACDVLTQSRGFLANATLDISNGTLAIGSRRHTYGSSGSYQVTITNASVTARTVLLGSTFDGITTLTIKSGSFVSISDSFLVGDAANAVSGTATMTGGSLFVTNPLATAVLRVSQGTLAISNATVAADHLVIEPAGTVTGAGTITGPVFNAGTLVAIPDMNPTNTGFVMQGPLTNSGSIIVSNGMTLIFAGPVVNTGLIDCSLGDVRFLSTFQNNGTYVPPPQRPGYALSFDGVNDYVQVPGALTNLPATEVTVEFWMKANAVALQAPFCQSVWQNGSVFAASVPYGTSGNGVVYWDFGTLPDGRLTYALTNSIVGTWHHFAFVASQGGNYMRIYQNGNLVASKTGMTPLVRANLDLSIGGYTAGVPFNGQLDEFRIWNVARSQSEIQTNMYHSIPDPTGPDLVGYWRFDEGTGLITRDSAAIGCTACECCDLLQNGVAWAPSTIPFVPTVLTTAGIPCPFGCSNRSLTMVETVVPNNLPTTAWFEWGTTTNYGNTTTPVNLGSGTSAIVTNATLTGLAWGTTYHFRAVASNTGGLSYGADFSLTFPLPRLNISQAGTNVILSIPGNPPWPDMVLQQSETAAGVVWTNIGTVSIGDGTNEWIPVLTNYPIGDGKFYRLKK